MKAIKNYILQQVASKSLDQEQAKQLLLELNLAAAADAKQDNEIAIIGMSGRFPKAENVEEFWQLLRDGVNCIDDYPPERKQDFEHILRNPYYTEFLIGDAIREQDIPNAHARAGYLKQIDKFDADFFGIPPSEATFMDPYQRLALETAWEVMEDAGYGDKTLFGSNTGIYIGKENTNYSLYRYCSVKDPIQLTGSWESIMASRISYLFNFRGPCMVIDTACSGGLVSVHMAAKAILNGECDVAIAGGINLSVTGEFNTRFQGGMNMDSVESDDGVIRTFDARANGTVWGEGIALVMLKPLKRALRDGDHIHAVIKGSAINNDGASNGLTAPNAEAQEDVIVKAWENAGINPESLQYIEAHGTGTVLGDPIEFKGLTASFRRFTQKKQFCAIGSLKTNMGHLVAASGCASLFKVIKQMQAGQMAPTINFAEPNPYIPFQNSPLYVNDRLQSWPTTEGPRRAAISSFGFSHTNCHMVIEEAPVTETVTAAKPQYCLTISTKKPALLGDYLARYSVRCERDDWSLADLCYTANTGRGHYAHRIAVLASSEQELRDNLTLAADQLANSATTALSMEIDGKVYIASHLLVSDKKTQRAAGEITAKEKSEISQQALSALKAFNESGNAVDLCRLAQVYSLGGDVQWAEFYAGEKRRRLSAPTYPFERVRRWADPKISKILDFTARLHPLVDTQTSNSAGEWQYQSLFNADTHWVLSDHKIQHTCVVPGTTYLEMARFCAAHAMGWQQLELANIFFLQPLVVEDQVSRLVRVNLSRDGDSIRFSIESRDQRNKDESWQRHVEGLAKDVAKAAGEDLGLAQLKASAVETIENYVGEADTGVFQFGPHWDCVRSAWSLPTSTLAKLALHDNLQNELDKFLIHPSVLDNAMNLTSQISGETYLPFMYKSFRFYAPFCQGMHSHIRSKNIEQGETNTYDVVLTTAEGKVIAEIEGYVTKRVHRFQFSDKVKNNCLSLRWLPAEMPAAIAQPNSLWLIGDKTGELAAAWRDAGVQVSSDVLEGEDIAAAVSEVLAKVQPEAIVIVHPALENGAVLHAENERTSLHQLFHLAKAIQAEKARLPFGLNLISENAQSLNGSEQSQQPFAAAASLLAITLDQESPDLAVRVVDTDALNAELAHHLFSLDTGKQQLLRKSELHQAELYAKPLEDESETSLVNDGVYLITGGIGGLGLATAKYIASRVKANVVLCGRRPLADTTEWASLAQSADDEKQHALYRTLVELKESLKSLSYVVVDVSDSVGVNDMLGTLKATCGKLNGIFHTAGIAGDGFILRKSFETYDQVLAAKTRGTLNLLSAVDLNSLDFCVLFSSITALTAGEGQGDYAAANAFMDAIATRYANVHAINWSSWAEVGMAAEFGVDDSVSPFEVIGPDLAFARLEALLKKPAGAAAIPADINAPVLAEVWEKLPFTLAPELASRVQNVGLNAEATQINADEVDIRGKSEEELSATEVTLAKIYATVLGLKEIDIFTNFQDMGGNSIIATHLLKVVEEYYPGLVDISDIFSYPAIDVMAEYIDEKLGISCAAVADESSEMDWEKMLDDVADGAESIDDVLGKV